MKKIDDARAPAHLPHHNAGRDLGGIRDIDGLKRRCTVDDETGCWHYMGGDPTIDHSISVYLAAERRVTTLGSAVGWLATGQPTPKGKAWVAICDNARCGNPDHRKLKAAGHHMRIKKAAKSIERSALYRAKLVAASHAWRKVSDEQVAEIRAASGTCAAIGRAYGLSESQTSKIRRGAARTAAAGMFSQLMMHA